ncbi:unnamed protein product [Rhizophagus irregularis]|uniref:Uncharacterized protein n=1 Tax=Rhizophagus irregularis TaxID=588596 RepID=A0A916E2Z1_9GLOM|nr:unnamed protein product [Rhizophagus irregularis]
MDDIRILVAIDFETIYSGNVIRPRSEGFEFTTNLQLSVSEAAAFHCLSVMRNNLMFVAHRLLMIKKKDGM